MSQVKYQNIVEIFTLGTQVDAEEAQRVLKDLIFQRWASDGCEERSETIKMVPAPLLLSN